MTDFLRLKIDFQDYQRLANQEEFLISIGNYLEDAVTDQRGDLDRTESVRGFFTEIECLWRMIVGRESEGAIRLNQDSPEEYLAGITPEQVGSMGLIDLITVLRKATCAEPRIEKYNGSGPSNRPHRPDPKRDRRFKAAYGRGIILAALRRLKELIQLNPLDIEGS